MTYTESFGLWVYRVQLQFIGQLEAVVLGPGGKPEQSHLSSHTDRRWLWQLPGALHLGFLWPGAALETYIILQHPARDAPGTPLQ